MRTIRRARHGKRRREGPIADMGGTQRAHADGRTERGGRRCEDRNADMGGTQRVYSHRARYI